MFFEDPLSQENFLEETSRSGEHDYGFTNLSVHGNSSGLRSLPCKSRQNTMLLLINSTSDFIGMLFQLEIFDSKEGMKKSVEDFLKSNEAGFTNARTKENPRFLSRYESVRGLEEKEFHKTAKNLFTNLYGAEPNE
jgi:hypothetical protein